MHDVSPAPAGILMIVVGSSLIARAAGYGDMHDDRYTYPMTHWFMMGANRETTGGILCRGRSF